MTMRQFAAKPGWKYPEPGGDAPITEQAPASTSEVERLLAEMLAELRSWAQQGRIASQTITVLPGVIEEARFDPPLFSIALTCDGPGTVSYRIPHSSSSDWVALAPTEVVVFNFIQAKIVTVGFRPLGAVASSIRLVGTY